MNKISGKIFINNPNSVVTYVDAGREDGKFEKVDSDKLTIGYCRPLKKFGLLNEPASVNLSFPSSGSTAAPDGVTAELVNSMFVGDLGGGFCKVHKHNT